VVKERKGSERVGERREAIYSQETRCVVDGGSTEEVPRDKRDNEDAHEKEKEEKTSVSH